MRLVKIGLVSLDMTIGAFKSNLKKVITYAKKMSEEKCEIGCFQEQVISGYPCEDLVQWKGFVKKQFDCLLEFKEETKKFNFPTLFSIGVTIELNGHLYNSAALVGNGEIFGIVPKEKLPTYGVFYEGRTLSPGLPYMYEEINGIPFGDLIFNTPFGVLSLEICEDLWVSDGPMVRRAYSGAELFVNLSASPFRSLISEKRKEMLALRSRDNESTVIYNNQSGGQDSLIFDGGSYIFQNGTKIFEGKRWCEDLNYAVLDLDKTQKLRFENTTWRSSCDNYLIKNPKVKKIDIHLDGFKNIKLDYPIPEDKNFFIPDENNLDNIKKNYYEDLISAMKTGLKGYIEKTNAFKSIGISLSGGKDSALSLFIAWLYAKEKI